MIRVVRRRLPLAGPAPSPTERRRPGTRCVWSVSLVPVVVVVVAVRVVAVRPRRRVPVHDLRLLRLPQRLAHVLRVHPNAPGGAPVSPGAPPRRGREELGGSRVPKGIVSRVPRELVRRAPHEAPVAEAPDQRPGLRRGRAAVAPQRSRAPRVAKLPHATGPPHAPPEARVAVCVVAASCVAAAASCVAAAVLLVLPRASEERPDQGPRGVPLGRGHLPSGQGRPPVLVVGEDPVVDERRRRRRVRRRGRVRRRLAVHRASGVEVRLPGFRRVGIDDVVVRGRVGFLLERLRLQERVRAEELREGDVFLVYACLLGLLGSLGRPVRVLPRRPPGVFPLLTFRLRGGAPGLGLGLGGVLHHSRLVPLPLPEQLQPLRVQPLLDGRGDVRRRGRPPGASGDVKLVR